MAAMTIETLNAQIAELEAALSSEGLVNDAAEQAAYLRHCEAEAHTAGVSTDLFARAYAYADLAATVLGDEERERRERGYRAHVIQSAMAQPRPDEEWE